MRQKELKKKKKKVEIEAKQFTKDLNKTYDFRKCKTIHVFRNEIRNIINMFMTNDEQNYSQSILKNDSNLEKVKEDVCNSAMVLLKGRKWCLKHLKVENLKT